MSWHDDCPRCPECGQHRHGGGHEIEQIEQAEQEAERMRALMGDEWADGMYD